MTGYLLSVVFFFKPNTSPFRNNDNSQERKEKRTLINEIKAVTLVDPEESQYLSGVYFKLTNLIIMSKHFMANI